MQARCLSANIAEHVSSARFCAMFCPWVLTAAWRGTSVQFRHPVRACVLHVCHYCDSVHAGWVGTHVPELEVGERPWDLESGDLERSSLGFGLE